MEDIILKLAVVTKISVLGHWEKNLEYWPRSSGNQSACTQYETAADCDNSTVCVVADDYACHCMSLLVVLILW